MADDGGVVRRYLVEGIVSAVCVLRLGYSRGNPRPGSPGSDNGGAQRRSPCWGHRFLEQTTDGGGAEVERCAFAVSASSSRRGMVQWCLGTDAV